MTIDHLSHSQLVVADGCLGRWEAERMHDTASVGSGPRDVGTIAHALAEAHLRALADGEPIEGSVEQAIATIGETAHLGDALAVFRKWLRTFDVPADRIVDVETYYERSLDGVPKIVGYPDLVYASGDSLVPRDLKTSWSSSMQPDYEFQLDLQAWLIEGTFPGKVLRTEIDFMRLGHIEPRKWDGYASALVEQRVRRIWARLDAALQSGEFPLTPGKHCGYCPIAPSCAQASLAEAQGEAILSPEGAQHALVQIARFEAAADRLKGTLKEYVMNTGEVAAGGVTASIEHTQTIGCKDVTALVERVGGVEKAAGFLSIDGRKKAVKELKGDARFADLFGVTRTSNKFKIAGKVDESAGGEDESEADVA